MGKASSLWLSNDEGDEGDEGAPAPSAAPRTVLSSRPPAGAFRHTLRQFTGLLREFLRIEWVARDKRIANLVDEMTRSDLQRICALLYKVEGRVLELMADRGLSPANETASLRRRAAANDDRLRLRL